MKKPFHLTLTLFHFVSSSPITPQLLGPYRYRTPDSWCTWIGYGWDQQDSLLRCAVPVDWICGDDHMATAGILQPVSKNRRSFTEYQPWTIITITKYASAPISTSVVLSPKETGTPMAVPLGLSQHDLTIPIPISRSSGWLGKYSVSENITRSVFPRVRTASGPRTQPIRNITVTILSEEEISAENLIPPDINPWHDFDMVPNSSETIKTPENKENQIKSATSVHASGSSLSFQPHSPITIILPSPSDAMSRLHDLVPFTTTTYPEDQGTRPSFPTQEDKPMPILEVSCLTRTRFLFSDFKITWGPSWDDQPGCQRLRGAMDRRGLITGWRCKQIADNELGYIMEAKGYRPMSPRSLVEGAIREAFAGNTLYYRGYETMVLCEKLKPWAEGEMW